MAKKIKRSPAAYKDQGGESPAARRRRLMDLENDRIQREQEEEEKNRKVRQAEAISKRTGKYPTTTADRSLKEVPKGKTPSKKMPTTTAERSLKEDTRTPRQKQITKRLANTMRQERERKERTSKIKGVVEGIRKGVKGAGVFDKELPGKGRTGTTKRKPNVETAAKGAETFEKIRKGNKTIGKSTPAPGMTKGKSTPATSKKKAATKGMPKRSAPKTTSPIKKARRSGKMINSDLRRLKSMVSAYTSTASRNTRPGVISGSQMRRRQEMGKLLSSLKKDLSAAQYKQLSDRIARVAAAGYKRGRSRKM